jgi:hypothetical protein
MVPQKRQPNMKSEDDDERDKKAVVKLKRGQFRKRTERRRLDDLVLRDPKAREDVQDDENQNQPMGRHGGVSQELHEDSLSIEAFVQIP